MAYGELAQAVGYLSGFATRSGLKEEELEVEVQKVFDAIDVWGEAVAREVRGPYVKPD